MPHARTKASLRRRCQLAATEKTIEVCNSADTAGGRAMDLAEPSTLAEAKGFVRLEHDDDDAVIGAPIKAARSQIRALTRRAAGPDLAADARSLAAAMAASCRNWPPLRAMLAARVHDAANNAG